MAYQPLSSLSNYLQGKSVVDNSAKNAAVQAKVNANAPKPMSARNKVLQQGIEKTFAPNSKTKVFGTPYKQ